MTEKPHQNLAIIGHVDHGKSTLVGLLPMLFDDVLGDGPCLEQEAAHERTFPVVDVADDGQILVWFLCHGGDWRPS